MRKSLFAIFLMPALFSLSGNVLAADINVNTTQDVIADDGMCSLREAVIAANDDSSKSGDIELNCSAGSGDDTINLPAGTYTLTITGTDESQSKTGDLNITSNLTINGVIGETIIDGNKIDRVFTFWTGQNMALNNIIIKGGYANMGGGISTGAILTITNCKIINNEATMKGGGIYNSGGELNISKSTISNNKIDYGAGIYNYNSGKLKIQQSVLSGNEGPAVSNFKGKTVIENSTLYDNKGEKVLIQGNDASNDLFIVNSTITGNEDLIGSTDGMVFIVNSIVTNNGQDECNGNIVTLGYNIFGDMQDCPMSKITTSGPDIEQQESGLASLVDNGNPGGEYYPLEDNSIAIGAANKSYCKTVDQLGNTRDSSCDIGAIEATCGDSVIQATSLNEECEGADLSSQTCGGLGYKTGLGSLSCTSACKFDASACVSSFCSDGIPDVGEGCDDGNADDTDDCLSTCVSATCGDGKVKASTETCDNGASNSDTAVDACRTKCIKAYCSDGVQDTGEECDDGNLATGDGCSDFCVKEASSTPPSSTSSSSTSSCGDGVQDTGEECDDGNLATGDGCSDLCVEEASSTPPSSTSSSSDDDGSSDTGDASSSEPPSAAGGCSLIR